MVAIGAGQGAVRSERLLGNDDGERGIAVEVEVRRVVAHEEQLASVACAGGIVYVQRKASYGHGQMIAQWREPKAG